MILVGWRISLGCHTYSILLLLRQDWNTTEGEQFEMIKLNYKYIDKYKYKYIFNSPSTLSRLNYHREIWNDQGSNTNTYTNTNTYSTLPLLHQDWNTTKGANWDEKHVQIHIQFFLLPIRIEKQQSNLKWTK